MDWLIKMWNDDGSAHIKCGMQRANASSPPSKDKTPRVYHGMKSSAAAIALAGVFANGSRIYKTIPIYNDYGNRLQEKAEKSWDWYMECVKNGTRNDEIDKGEIRSGRANRPLDIQDMMAVAAAIYLYALTNNEKYHDYIKENYRKVPPMAADVKKFHESGFINFPRQLGLGYVLYMGLPSADLVIVEDLQKKWRIILRHASKVAFSFCGLCALCDFAVNNIDRKGAKDARKRRQLYRHKYNYEPIFICTRHFILRLLSFRRDDYITFP
jgi:hypothetical protein